MCGGSKLKEEGTMKKINNRTESRVRCDVKER
jgi:hypothetical protein